MSAPADGSGRNRADDVARPTSAHAGTTTDASVRVAARSSFVAVMRLAATVSMDAAAQADEYDALGRAIAGTAPQRRTHVEALVGAALGAGAMARAARAVLPWEARYHRARIRVPADHAVAMAWVGPVGEEVTVLDVDGAIRRSTAIVVRSLEAPYGSEARERGWDELEEAAFAPCFEASSACLGGRDRRRTLLILWLALRRRRPAAAAVLRRCLSLDRAWRSGVGAP